MSADGFCADLLSYGQVTIFKQVGIVMVVLGCTYIFMSFIILYFVKLQEYYAQSGDTRALQSVIFPLYVRILWANAFVNLYIGLICFAFDFHPYGGEGSRGDRWTFATMWALQHLVVEGVAILLMQKGLGINAARKAFKRAFAWGLWTLFVQISIYNTRHEVAFALNLSWNAMLFAFYFCLWVTPQRRLYRRPAVIMYARFWCLFRAYCSLSSLLYYDEVTAGLGNCFYVFGSLFGFAFLEPLVLYYTFLQDSRWWQGLDISQGRRVLSAEQIRSPLQGVDINLHSAQSLAESLDHIGIGTSKTSKGPAVRLLNFAYISMEKTKLLGSGSFSKVYLGKYRNKPCAIKMIFTIDLTQDIISRIAAEAQLLSSVSHPNVVEILGVSVLPPSVCILLELCQYGSLADLISGTGSSNLQDVPGFIRDFLRGGSIIGRASPKGIALSWTDRLSLAVGCTKGLVALHTLNKNLCHRDVKSFNFLVDAQFNAKISDLELGITDDLLVNTKSKVKRDLQNSSKRVPADASKRKLSGLSVSSNSKSTSGSEMISELGIGEGVLAADEFLANWAAPEVIKDAQHSQASDVYSLGLVFWELLSGSVPFNDVRRQDDIRFMVINGDRPIISDCFLMGSDRHHFSTFIALMKQCWAQEFEHRPSAQEVLDMLEVIIRERCYSILRDTDAVPAEEITANSRSGFTSLFTGRSSLNNKNNSNNNDELIPSILKKLDDEGGSLQDFNSRKEAWMLVLPDAHGTVVWTTNTFEDETGLQIEEIEGKPLPELAIFKGMSADSKLISNTFLQNIREIKANQLHHALLELQITRTASFKPDLNGEDVKQKVNTLFSVHAFPVPSRTSVLSIPIPTQGEEEEAPSNNTPFRMR